MTGQCVYWIKAGDLVKVGVAKDPWARMAVLQTGNAKRLELVGATDCEVDGVSAYDLERTLHEMLAPLHVHGEWFKNDVKKHDVAHRRAWVKCRYPEAWERWWSP